MARGVPLGIHPVLDRAVEHNNRIILYGAGKIGQRIAAALAWFGHPVSLFWDRHADLLGPMRDGIAVVKPDVCGLSRQDRANVLIIVTIFSEKVAERLRDELMQAGYANVVSDRGVITALLKAECESRVQEGRFDFDLMRCHLCPAVSDVRSRCDIFDRELRERFVRGIDVLPRLDLVLPSVGVLISNRCTMTCEGCNHLRDQYGPDDHRDLSADQVLDDVKKLLSAVDLVNKLVLVGGEALLHPQAEEIVDRLLGLPKVGMLQLITNGTVVPKGRHLFELLANRRVIVEVSDYGEHVPKPLRSNIERFTERLDAHKVQYRQTKTLQWFDFGSFDDRDYSEDEVRDVYRTCCFVSHDLFDGRLYKCSRSAYGTVIGKLPEYPDDYVDVRRLDQLSLRARLVEFLSVEYVQACRHCNGASAACTIEAGKQVITVKKRVTGRGESRAVALRGAR